MNTSLGSGIRSEGGSSFLPTDDSWRDYRRYVDQCVEFVREPREESYGTVAVFQDLYGNQWELIQSKH